MRFGMVHRLMTNALAALGVIALVASGQFNDWVSGIILACLVGALCVRESWQRHPAMRHLDSGALLIIAAIQVGRFIFDASLLDVLIEFAAALQIIRLATRKGAAHDQQVIVLALLHLIAGTVLGGGLAYGACFIGVLIVAPGALVLSHLRREVEGNYRQGARDRTGLPVDVPRILRSRRVVGKSFLAVTCLLSIPIFLFTAALFVVFPRVGLSLLLLNRGQTGRMVGFSGKVDLGGIGVLRSDPTIAMRLHIPESIASEGGTPRDKLTLHLRGTALDQYEDKSWTQTGVGHEGTSSQLGGFVTVQNGFDPKRDAKIRIDLEPIDPPVLFLPLDKGGVTALRIERKSQIATSEVSSIIKRGAEGTYSYLPQDERGVRYEAYVRKGALTFTEPLSPSERARYLQLPPKLPARVAELAKEWTKDAHTPLEKTRAVRDKLKSGDYEYSLNSNSGDADNPLDHFLFESKKGHCEYYSTAMALMLRTVDVPTRNVTGFLGATRNQFADFYVVRQGDAHSWVEVYIDGQGWRTEDPTPSSGTVLTETDKTWAYIRDLLEATSQQWDQNVEGYDLQQQMSLWNTLQSNYPSTATTTLSKKRIFLYTGFGLILGAGGAYLFLRRRRVKAKRPMPGIAPKSPTAILATSLYEALELAMSAHGLNRASGIPPLKHAQALEAIGHPLSSEIMELTEIYLSVRFGGDELDEAGRRGFETRVKAVRSAPQNKAAV